MTSQEADHPNKKLSAKTGALLEFAYVWRRCERAATSCEGVE